MLPEVDPHKFIPTPELVTTPEIRLAILDQVQPFDVDWQKPASELDEQSRLLRLARVKALLPPDNAIEEKTTHDVTLENYMRLALKAAGDIRTLDLFLRHLENTLTVDDERVQELAQQVFWIWAPVAEIAGMYHHKSALEELAFKAMMPEEYARTSEEYDLSKIEGADGVLAQIKADLSTALELGLDLDRVDYTISARAKSKYSVWRKLRKDARDDVQLFDLMGFRVILDGDEAVTAQQCYAAYVAVAEAYDSDPERFKDYITDPKATGYQSLHSVHYLPSGIPFEFQVRTRAMHAYAESDNILSHQIYEAFTKLTPGKIHREFRKVPKLYVWRNAATKSIRYNDGSTEQVLGDDILFFRTDGNLYKMPAGGTALDASFRIHNHRALRTGHISCNGRLIGFDKPIAHGDVLEVNYKSNYPTQSWQFTNLQRMVNSRLAVRAINRAETLAQSSRYIALGRLIVAQHLGVDVGMEDPTTALDETDRLKLAQDMGLATFDDLLRVIGKRNGGGKPGRVANLIKDRLGLFPGARIKLERETPKVLADEDVMRLINIPNDGGLPDCKIAGCCRSKISYGDDVIARVSSVEAIIKIHRRNCENIHYKAGLISCTWQEN